MVIFEKCNNATSAVTCKSEAEIEEFLQFKYLIAIWNQKQFIQDAFGHERVLKNSKTNWFPFTPLTRSDYVMHVQRTHMHFSDS